MTFVMLLLAFALVVAGVAVTFGPGPALVAAGLLLGADALDLLDGGR